MRKRFDPIEDFGQQVREIAATRIREALRTAANPDESAAERVHAARTEVKKLRALLHLVKPGFADYRAENRAARAAARSLSPLRDLTVHAGSLQRLADGAGEPETVTALAGIIEAQTPDSRLQEAALDAFMSALAPMLSRVAGWQVAGDVATLQRDGLAATYKAARRAMKRAARSGTASDLHEWRKRVKHHLQALRLLRGLPDGGPHETDAVRSLARRLGQHHDDTVFATFSAAQGDPFRPLAAAADREAAELAQGALVDGRSLFGEPTKRAFPARQAQGGESPRQKSG